MKKGIHPEYVEAKVICSCGNVIQTRATKPELHIEICSTCHPFFTGKQKFVDAAGRVERFEKRFKKHQQLKSVVQKKEKPAPTPLQAKPQVDKPEVKPVKQIATEQIKQPEAKPVEKPAIEQAEQPEAKTE